MTHYLVALVSLYNTKMPTDFFFISYSSYTSLLFFAKVLVHGSAEATDHLKQHCLKHICQHVYAPQIEETIDVTSDLCAYKVSTPCSNVI